METEKNLPWIIRTWKGRVLVALLLICIFAGVVFLLETRHFTNVEVKATSMREEDEHLSYIDFGDYLFSYSRDGASMTDYEGTAIWNESFDMENPAYDVSDTYVVVYDKESTKILLFSKNGLENEMEMPVPVSRAAVSEQGSIAVLMQEDDSAHLKLFDKSGGELASGELHMTNTGYPIALDLSADGRSLLISVLDLNIGDVKTTLNFYDFSEAGKKKENNIAAKFSYANMVIPQVSFFENGEAVAFGDSEIIIYTANDEPTVKKELFLDGEIKSVVTSKNRFATISVVDNPNGTVRNTLTCYNQNGAAVFAKRITKNYTYAQFMSNGEIVLSDRENINIYTKYGVHKLSYVSSEPVLAVMPWDGMRNYYFIKKKYTEKVKLK